MSEAKVTVNLTIKERVDALKLFNEFKGNLELMAVLLEDVKPFAVQEAEWTEAKLVKTPGADGSESWQWDDTVVLKDIELQSKTVEYLKGKIKAKSEAGEITIADVALASLDKKL